MKQKIIDSLFKAIRRLEGVNDDRIRYNTERIAITLKYRYNKFIEKLKIK